MSTREQLPGESWVSETGNASPGSAGRSSLRAITGGGTEGNEQLTTMTSVILVLMLAVLGLTIVRIGQLIWLHLFVGLLLLGPVALKMSSTGYRFLRYYTGNRAYREKGPPETILRLIAPIVVITTVIVFVTGVVLLFHGPANRNELVMIHKVSFIVWIAFTAIHVLGHLPALGKLFGLSTEDTGLSSAPSGATGRWLALSGAVVAGLVIAIVLLPQYGAWTAHGAIAHHHHHG